MTKFISTWAVLAGILCLTTGCLTTKLYKLGVGKRLEIFEEIKIREVVLTDEYVVLAFTAKITPTSMGADSGLPQHRWATLELIDIINEKERFKYAVHASEPGHTGGEKVMIVPSLHKEACLENGNYLDMCLIDTGYSLTGTLVLQSDTLLVKRYNVDLPYPPQAREYRNLWADLALLLLTPVTVAIDLVSAFVYVLSIYAGGGDRDRIS